MNSVSNIIRRNWFWLKQRLKPILLKEAKCSYFIINALSANSELYTKCRIYSFSYLTRSIDCFINAIPVKVNISRDYGLGCYVRIKNSDLMQYENVIAFPKKNRVWNITEPKQPRKPEVYHQPLQKYIVYSDKETNPTIKSSIDYINASKINHHCKYENLFFQGYDVNKKSFRHPSWVWCNAILIKMIIELPYLCKLSENIEACTELMRRLCDFQVDEGINQGAFLVRNDLSCTTLRAIIPWYAPNDSAFIASNGLIPLYLLTKNNDYLSRAISVANWILKNGLTNDNRILVGFRQDTEQWIDDWLYVDAGFTINLFSALYKTTMDNKWKDVSKLVLNKYIEMFFYGKGQLYKIWKKDGSHVRNHFTRGYAWALDGILSFCECATGSNYCNIAETIIEQLLVQQNQDGSWNYQLNHPNRGIDNKAVSIIAYHLLRAAKLMARPDWVAASKRALDWCANNIQSSCHEHMVKGYISAMNDEGDIVGNRFGNVSFLYASAYYLLAENLYHEIINKKAGSEKS